MERTEQKRPKTWLVESILVTIFCCLPFGIVGIINAAKVEARYEAGDIGGAFLASDRAQKWVFISVICGLLAIIFYLLFYKNNGCWLNTI